MKETYEVLSPWAEVDPIPPRGISPRETGLNGKTVGLFADYKRAAQPILTAVERMLKERFPEIKSSWFVFEKCSAIHEAGDKTRLEDWVKGIDMAITAVGD
jgi:hypothetical protein